MRKIACFCYSLKRTRSLSHSFLDRFICCKNQRRAFPDDIYIFHLHNFIDAFVLHRASHNFWLIQIGFSVYSTSHNQMLYAFSLLLSSHQSFLLWLLLRSIGTKKRHIFFQPAADKTLSIQSH